MNNDIAIVLLAAGSSSRLGTAKQLLKHKGDFIINNMIQQATRVIDDSNIYVVLGAYSKAIREQLHNTNIKIVLNNNWKEGMGSSIRSAVSKIHTNLDIKACIISVIDQPYLDADVFKGLIALYRENEDKIISSKYRNVYGPPVLFGRQLFRDLQKLEGDRGAKALVRSNLNDVLFYNWDKGLIDIDEEDHLSHLKPKDP